MSRRTVVTWCACMALGVIGTGSPLWPGSTDNDSGIVAPVSLVQLIAAPEKFEGRRVRVQGFCRFVFEEQSLYLHREDSDTFNAANAVWLATKERHENLNDTFVRVEGTFTTKDKGHLGVWPGALVRITRLERARTRSGR
jgi:hypothetical protein